MSNNVELWTSNNVKLWAMGGFLSLSLVIAKQLILTGINPIHLAMLQAAGSIIFLAFMGIEGLLRSIRSKLSYYFFASMLGFTIPQLVVFYSVEHVGTSVAGLAYAFPLFITFFLNHLTTKSQRKAKPFMYMGCAFLGSLIYLYKPDVMDFNSEQFIWLVLLSLAPLTLSIANIYRSREWPTGVSVFHVALLTNVFSFFSYALFAAYKMPPLPDLKELGVKNAMLLITFMAIAAKGQYLLFSLQKTASPIFIGQTGSITALFGGVLGFIVFKESYQLSTLFGSLLILFGVAGFSRQQTFKSIQN